MQQRQLVQVGRQLVGQLDDDREDHRRRTDHCRADQHRLGRCLEGVARAVVLLELLLGVLEVRVEAKIGFDLFLHVLDTLDLAQFVHGLGVIRHRAVTIHGYGHRSHAQEAEGHQAERENRCREFKGVRHQGHDR